jgi:hypothetical protein
MGAGQSAFLDVERRAWDSNLRGRSRTLAVFKTRKETALTCVNTLAAQSSGHVLDMIKLPAPRRARSRGCSFGRLVVSTALARRCLVHIWYAVGACGVLVSAAPAPERLRVYSRNLLLVLITSVT